MPGERQKGNPMKKFKKRLLFHPVTSALVLFFIRLISATYRYKVEGLQTLRQQLKEGERVLLCTWHQQFFPDIAKFGIWFKKHKPALMISRSADGQIIANVANRVGWHTARGSSTKGGNEAMVEMLDWIRKHGLGAHILDGPTGPFGVVKPGAIRIAQKSEALLVPIQIQADKYWQIESWDRFLIPKPFSRVTLSFHQGSLPPAQNASGEDFEAVRASLESRMQSFLY